MSDAKVIRGQLRQIVKEEMQDMLLTEMKSEISRAILKDVSKRLEALEDLIREKLTVIDERSKDTMSYLVRQSMQPAPISKPQIKLPGGEVAEVEADGSFTTEKTYSFKSE